MFSVPKLFQRNNRPPFPPTTKQCPPPGAAYSADFDEQDIANCKSQQQNKLDASLRSIQSAIDSYKQDSAFYYNTHPRLTDYTMDPSYKLLQKIADLVNNNQPINCQTLFYVNNAAPGTNLTRANYIYLTDIPRFQKDFIVTLLNYDTSAPAEMQYIIQNLLPALNPQLPNDKIFKRNYFVLINLPSNIKQAIKMCIIQSNMGPPRGGRKSRKSRKNKHIKRSIRKRRKSNKRRTTRK